MRSPYNPSRSSFSWRIFVRVSSSVFPFCTPVMRIIGNYVLVLSFAKIFSLFSSFNNSWFCSSLVLVFIITAVCVLRIWYFSTSFAVYIFFSSTMGPPVSPFIFTTVSKLTGLMATAGDFHTVGGCLWVCGMLEFLRFVGSLHSLWDFECLFFFYILNVYLF